MPQGLAVGELGDSHEDQHHDEDHDDVLVGQEGARKHLLSKGPFLLRV